MAAKTAEVTVWGLRALDRALKDLAPELRRDLYSRIGKQVKAVAIDAQQRTTALSKMGDKSPIGRHASEIAGSVKMRRGAKSRNARASAFGFRIEQSHGYGVIAEFARKPVTPQGKALVSALNRKYPADGGRFLWSAMEDHKATVDREVMTAVREIERQLQSKIDAMTVGTA